MWGEGSSVWCQLLLRWRHCGGFIFVCAFVSLLVLALILSHNICLHHVVEGGGGSPLRIMTAELC